MSIKSNEPFYELVFYLVHFFGIRSGGKKSESGKKIRIRWKTIPDRSASGTPALFCAHDIHPIHHCLSVGQICPHYKLSERCAKLEHLYEPLFSIFVVFQQFHQLFHRFWQMSNDFNSILLDFNRSCFSRFQQIQNLGIGERPHNVISLPQISFDFT